MEKTKPTHIKPALYAYFYQEIKDVAEYFGYNLLLNGSMHRDLDLVAVPWSEFCDERWEEMLEKFADIIGGEFDKDLTRTTHHGRITCVINVRRRTPFTNEIDPQFYLDISIMPINKSENVNNV